MSSQTIARRYSVALADVVSKSGEASEVQNELRQFQQMMEESPALGQALANPAVAFDQKYRLVETLIARTNPRPATANFLRILLKNQRISDLAVINERFAAVLDERAGMIAAEVTTAKPLSDVQKHILSQRLTAATGKKVNLKFHLDENIIGGVVTRIGSTVFDGSVKTQLENLKKEMIGKQ